MTTFFPFALALLCLISSATVAAAQNYARQDAYQKLLSKYPYTYALQSLIRKHIYNTEDPAHNTVMIQSRCEPDRRVPGYFLRPTVKSIRESSPAITHDLTINVRGIAKRDVDVFNYARHSDGMVLLSAEQMTFVRHVLQAMPPSKAPTSVGDLLLVTYLRGNKYAVRLYDTRKLPEVVRKLEQTWGKKTYPPHRHPSK